MSTKLSKESSLIDKVQNIGNGPQTTTSSESSTISTSFTPSKLTKEANWSIFVQSYIKLSIIGCDQILSQKKFLNEDKFLIISILFNLKHALEIVIKTIDTRMNQEDHKVAFNHNSKEHIKKIVKAIKAKYPQNVTIEKEINILSQFVQKYSSVQIMINYLSKENFTISDLENTFLKYPENSASIVIDYSKLITSVSIADIENIKNDLDRMQVNIKEIEKVIDEQNIKKQNKSIKKQK
jgi:hypothetical protein